MTAGSPRLRGHRTLPHTADLLIEAWGPTREACVEEALAGMVAAFAAGVRREGARLVAWPVPARSRDDELLLSVLEEALYLLDTEGVPVAVDLEDRGGQLTATFSVVPVEAVEVTGAVPKAVALHGLHVTGGAGRWRCQVTIDV